MGTAEQDLVRELLTIGWSEEAAKLGLKCDFCCYYCHRDLLETITDYHTWHREHVIPTSKGGADDFPNLVLACKLCNFIKRNFDPRSIATDGASQEELESIAYEYVRKGRLEKQRRLDEVKAVLERNGYCRTTREKAK